MSEFLFSVDHSRVDHWRQMSVLLRHAPGEARLLLQRPPPPGIPGKRPIARLLEPARWHGLTELLEKHLLSGFLMTPKEKQDQWRLPVQDILRRLFPETDPKLLRSGQWIHVPILAVQGKDTRIITMMTGLLSDDSGCRGIGSPLPGVRTSEAVQRAFRVAGRSRAARYWFLQEKDEKPLQGTSLALPVALALVLHRDSSLAWPRGLYATGGLKTDGAVVPVDHVREKYRCVACDCRLFLAPADMALSRDSDRPVQACATFADACFAASLYSDGITAADISLYQACWISERNFFNHFHEIPPPMLTSERADDYYRLVRSAPEHYLNLLAAAFRRCNHDRRRGQILAELFGPDVLENVAEKSPDSAFAVFHWCLAAIAFYNYCGRVRETDRWQTLTNRLCTGVELPEINRFINHDFVSRRFNRYDFRPEPTQMLADALAREERKQEIYPGSNGLLGALYGTLAQNYGFCGPDYFNALLEMTARAGKAFGSKYHGENRRLLNYEIYGYLDCGRIEQAGSLMAKYLGLKQESGPEEWLQKIKNLLSSSDPCASFEVALVMRLLNETGYIASPGEIRQCAVKIYRRQGHPWQLTAHNLGWLALAAGEDTEAGRLFRHSLRICLADSETMRPMGLLALAGLHASGAAGRAEYETARKIRQWLIRANCLHTTHFQPVLALTDSEQLLTEVRQQQGRLFPFSYR